MRDYIERTACTDRKLLFPGDAFVVSDAQPGVAARFGEVQLIPEDDETLYVYRVDISVGAAMTVVALRNQGPIGVIGTSRLGRSLDFRDPNRMGRIRRDTLAGAPSGEEWVWSNLPIQVTRFEFEEPVILSALGDSSDLVIAGFTANTQIQVNFWYTAEKLRRKSG